MNVVARPFDGVLVLRPRKFFDARGFFLETFESSRYRELGIFDEFVQDNHSRSVKGVLRGMHFTKNKPQAQLLTVMSGRVFDVVVDLRKTSPSFGKWFGMELSDEGSCQIYMAHGFAHGFCVLSDVANLHYKVSQKYDPTDDAGLRWDDPDVAINWPGGNFVISDRDQRHPYLRDIA